MYHIAFLVGRVIKANWETYESLCCDITVELIVLIQGWGLFGAWQYWAWKVGKAMSGQRTIAFERILEDK
jgi:hypothetical protein